MDSNGSNATCSAPCATAYWHSKPDAYWCGFLQTCWFVIFVHTHTHSHRQTQHTTHTHTYANRSCKQSPLHTVHTARVSSWNQLEERNNIIRLGLWFRAFCSTRKLICRCLQHQTVQCTDLYELLRFSTRFTLTSNGRFACAYVIFNWRETDTNTPESRRVIVC